MQSGEVKHNNGAKNGKIQVAKKNNKMGIPGEIKKHGGAGKEQ